MILQLFKFVEIIVGIILGPWFDKQQVFCAHQYDYGKGRGYKNVLAINVCSWLLAMEQADLVGRYCSDVSGTFDRVSRVHLVGKLKLLGLQPDLLSCLRS